MKRRLLAAVAILLAGCSASRSPACDVEGGPRVYEARGIGQQWIDYVWVELGPSAALRTGPSAALRTGPSTAPEGSPAPLRAIDGRLFVASADPVGAIVPTMIDLPCATGPVEYAPAPVEFAVEAGTAPQRLKASYGWGSCAACSECYMRWTFSLDLEGQLEDGALVADLVLNETFHSGPMPIVSVRMQDVTAACTEPRITCEPGGDCGRLRFEGRE